MRETGAVRIQLPSDAVLELDRAEVAALEARLWESTSVAGAISLAAQLKSVMGSAAPSLRTIELIPREEAALRTMLGREF